MCHPRPYSPTRYTAVCAHGTTDQQPIDVHKVDRTRMFGSPPPLYFLFLPFLSTAHTAINETAAGVVATCGPLFNVLNHIINTDRVACIKGSCPLFFRGCSNLHCIATAECSDYHRPADTSTLQKRVKHRERQKHTHTHTERERERERGGAETETRRKVCQRSSLQP